MRILFTGGGTGGHIYPLIAIKNTFDKNNREHSFSYIGPDGFVKSAFENKNIKCKFILAGKLRRYFSLVNIIDLLKIPIGLIQSLWHLFWIMPDVIFSKGGYGSIPVVLAGWIYRIPIIIHESDTVPGLANRISAPLAKKIIISFEETRKYFPKNKIVVAGNPVREELIQGNVEQAQKIFKLNLKTPTVLIMGGSQGAQRINELVLNVLPRLLKKTELIHICGKTNFNNIEKEAKKILEDSPELLNQYHLYPFLKEELKHAFSASDIIISRASAGAIFEIAAIGKPAILIPLSTSAANHQTKNTQVLSRAGGAIVLEEGNLTVNMFLNTILDLLNNPEKMKTMEEKNKLFYRPETNQRIVQEIIGLTK